MKELDIYLGEEKLGLVSRLAAAAGLRVSDTRLERFSKAGSTFFSRRFDREGERRIHYASAMTMSGAWDGGMF